MILKRIDQINSSIMKSIRMFVILFHGASDTEIFERMKGEIEETIHDLLSTIEARDIYVKNISASERLRICGGLNIKFNFIENCQKYLNEVEVKIKEVDTSNIDIEYFCTANKKLLKMEKDVMKYYNVCSFAL